MPRVRHIALLRGVNLAAKRRVPMPALREALEEAGLEDVRTLLQSGNVAVTSSSPAKAVRAEIERVIAERFGVETDAVMRTRAEIEALLAADPLGDVVTDPRRCQVVFLDRKPTAAAVRALEQAEVEPERVLVAGREIHCWHPDGVGRSPLVALLGKTDLGAVATARNWSTVGKLRDL